MDVASKFIALDYLFYHTIYGQKFCTTYILHMWELLSHWNPRQTNFVPIVYAGNKKFHKLISCSGGILLWYHAQIQFFTIYFYFLALPRNVCKGSLHG